MTLRIEAVAITETFEFYTNLSEQSNKVCQPGLLGIIVLQLPKRAQNLF